MFNYSNKQSASDLSDSKASVQEAIKHFEEGFRIVGGLLEKAVIRGWQRKIGTFK